MLKQENVMKVLLLGATGLTGGLVLSGLLARDEVESVIVPVRKRLESVHTKLHQQEMDFDRMEDHAGLFAVDVIICCLGTTIKKAGSQEQFRKVDYGYCLKAAELGQAAGARAFILMSAIGSSSSSTIFYNRIKGELENSVKGLGYSYLSIYHPSLLLGNRPENRLGEALGAKAMPLINRVLLGPLEKYRGIEAGKVASAMVNETCSLASESVAEQVVQIREYEDIVKLSDQTA
ncbi:NADH(P)-binding [Marinobacter sp. LV10R510-11A]|nr:NADH(P)-binding [Marinobacter sp. LV10R510-11A]